MAEPTSHKPLVAFLGPPSSFTHQATKSTFPEEEYEYQPVVAIKDVFDAVQSGAAQLGVVPFENSTHGVVTFTLDALADRQGAYADLCVCGEVYLDVHHFLLGYRQPEQQHGDDSEAKQPGDEQKQKQKQQQKQQPLVPLDHVKKVLSHPQALGQTNGFLSRHLGGAERVDVSSTSRAAEVASRDPTGETAAVAGEIAAAMFGLDVLARFIEDRDDNTTRFFVLRRDDDHDDDHDKNDKNKNKKSEGRKKEEDAAPEGRGYKSLVSFTVPHRSPGALAGVLDAFNKYGLNLTSINSLPSLIQPFQYLFFVEFEGSRRHDDPEGRVEGALGEIGRVAEGWRWLGSWERQR